MVKITDVARHAGVSPSTVSYVLSGKRSISEETRRRVRESIRELGYRPHAARALASSRSNVLALMIPLRSGIAVPVVMQFAVSVVTAARRHDHDVLLLTQQEGEDGLRRVADSALVDALIVMDVQMKDPRLPLLRSLDRPSVLIGFPADADDLTCIDLDFHARRRLRRAPRGARAPRDRADRVAARGVRAADRLRAAGRGRVRRGGAVARAVR